MMRTSNKYIRPYKVEIYGLQDNFIGTLQSYNDSSIGRVQEPILEISTDGTQKFTCSIPKYYIDKTTNQKLPNPRWEDTENGILAENTRVLKVFVKYPNETKVYPLIIDNLTTKRDDHFAVYREITANGLAFAELGKLGYKLELTHATLEADYKENSKTVATINYWLDKVFPNERDANGKVVKWLTPWCYEIRMEWESLTGEILASDKIYDSPCVNSWGLTNDGKMLSPQGVSDYIEKARYIDCQYSNKYNITQTIAETYEVFCTYEHKCAENGTFIRNYTDENGNHWTGRKVVFYNRAIDMENPLVVNYQKNLNTVSRTVDSSEIYTKMYVKPIESTVVPSGLISIADTSLNPILDDFILNFDYLRSIGNITDEQAQFIDDYQVELHKINTSLKTLGESRAEQEILRNEQEAKVATYEKQLKSAKEALVKYEILRDNGSIGEVVINETQGTPISIYFYLKDDNYYYAQLTQEGIDASTLAGYSSQKITDNNKIFSKDKNLSDFISFDELNKNKNTFFIKYNKENYPESIVTSKDNSALANGRAMWLTMRYVPDNYYADICLDYENLINSYASKKADAEKLLKLYDKELQSLKDEEANNLTHKNTLNELFENRLGPALREGHWTPDSYEDPGENCVEDINIEAELNEEKPVSMYFDTELLDTEEKGWYQKDTTNLDEKEYFDYIDISKAYKAWSEASVSIEDLTIHLQYTKDYPIPNTCTDINKNYYFYLYYSGEKYYFTVKGVNNPENYYFRAFETASGLKLTLWNKDAQTEQAIAWIPESQAGHAVTSINIAGLSMGTCIYPSAGFTFSYLKQKNDFIPIIIINNSQLYEEDNYKNHLTNISYSFLNSSKITHLCSAQDIKKLNDKSVLGYPRIKINSKGVMYESDSLIITPFQSSTPDKLTFDNAYTALKKYEDYLVTTTKGEPVFTLKVTGVNTLEKILDWPYHIQYKKTRANELLYMDAVDVAYDSSRPRYSYELSVANLPQNVNNIRLGQLVQINDYSVGLRCETGYISTIKFNLDSPQDDDLTIQDYTTKFEDLFASITATNEAMKQNQNLYNTVAGSFAPNGAISGSVLQTALYNNELAFNYSHTRVEISPTEGIILTNLTPYDNGVYGQLVLKGGGVFLSSSLDAQDNRIWSEAITPTGINASLLTAGAIDTSLIRIYSGDNLSFQWNSEGLFAYKRDEEGRPTMDAYVKYSDQGLQFIMEEPNNEANCSVHLGWEGLKLAAQSGALTLTAQDGLQIFYPEENGTSQAALQVGRWSRDNVGAGVNTINYYGMRLFDTSGNETFTVDNYGNLMITGTMQSGRFASGILGYGWQIRNDGTAEFQDVHVRGTISSSVFEYKETTAVGGELYIGPTLIVDYNRAKEAKFIYLNNQLTLEVDLGFTDSDNTELCGRTWAIGDVLGINCYLTNDAGDKYEIKNLRMRLITINNTIDELVSSTLQDTSLNVFYDENGNPIQLEDIKWKGLKVSGPINCIFIGSENDTSHNRKGILLTAMADDGPYMDIYDDAKSKIAGAPKVRIGNLDGLSQLPWDDNTMKPGGYGLYSDNVHLTGAIYATSGKIGSLSIDEVESANSALTITLTSSTAFTYTDQTPSIDIGFDLYSGGKRIEKKSNLPAVLREDTYQVSYQVYENDNWHNFTQYEVAQPLFDNDGNLINNLYTFNNIPTGEKYRVVIYRTTAADKEIIIYSNIARYSYVKNGPQGEQGPPGEQGETGEAAWSYYLSSNYDNITVDVDGMIPSNETDITITVTRAQGSQAPEIYPNLTTSNFRVQLVSAGSDTATTIPSGSGATTTTYKIDAAKGTISFKPQLKAANTTQYRFYEITLYHAGKQVKTLSIPYILSSRLVELGKVREGEVVINNGKIYAEALTTGSVIAGKVSAGAIQTGAIASDSTLYLLSNGTTDDKKFNVPPEFTTYNESTNISSFPDWQPHSKAKKLSWSNAAEYAMALSKGFEDIWEKEQYASGVRIGQDGVRIRGGGVFEVAMENFTVTSDGDVTIAGNITATGGKIGCLDVDDKTGSLTAILKDGTGLSIQPGAIIIGGSTDGANEGSLSITKDSVNVGTVNVKNLTVTNLTFNNDAAMKYGWIYSKERPENVHEVIWVKPDANTIISSAEATWPTRDGRYTYSQFYDYYKNYWATSDYKNSKVPMPTISIPSLSTSPESKFTFTLTVPLANPTASSVSIIPYFNFEINGKSYEFQGNEISLGAWSGAQLITITKANMTENLFELIKNNQSSTVFQFKDAKGSRGAVCIDSNSSIILKGSASGVGSSNDPVECSIYYIP